MSQIQLSPHWKEVQLGEVVTLQRGKDLPTEQRQDGSYPVVGSNGIVGYHSEFVAHGPGVMVGRSGSVGKVTWVEGDYWALNTTLWVKDFHGNAPLFIRYFLNYLDLGKYTSGVSVPTLNRNVVHPLKVRLPPLPEQSAIAHTLRTIQKAKEARQRELELERERKAALMQYLFTYGTRNEPRKEAEVGEIAESWKVVKFGDVCESSAFGPRFSGSLYSTSGNVATLRTTDMDKEGNINYSTMPFASLELEKYKNHLLKPKDFLITRSGSCGIAAVFESFDKPVIPGAFLIRFRLSKELDPYFLRYYINSSIGSSRISQLARGAIQQNISGTSLRNFAVPLPSLPEQVDIVNILGTCDRKITALEQEAAFLDELFCAMLEELMAGRLSALPLVEEKALS